MGMLSAGSWAHLSTFPASPQGTGWEKPLGWSGSLPQAPTVPTSQRDPEQQNNHFQHHYPSQTPASNFNQRSWCCFKICRF